ncbi:MAG: hypothetical protein A2Z74_07490 [Chloroflexi bacterium RBG_13_46_9]|nr:MAG: hypothetical protein A2Z74_07490 [Chloroflexi bacterium RBG_13_46_9]
MCIALSVHAGGIVFSMLQAPSGPVKLTWSVIIALLAGIYEVVIRAIPTVGNYSFIGKIIDILKWLSEFLNRKKK